MDQNFKSFFFFFLFFQWAQIVVVLERAVRREKLIKYQMEYSIKLADPREDNGLETRGLMVIKHTKKTRAKQRKQAVTNWKVLFIQGFMIQI